MPIPGLHFIDGIFDGGHHGQESEEGKEGNKEKSQEEEVGLQPTHSSRPDNFLSAPLGFAAAGAKVRMDGRPRWHTDKPDRMQMWLHSVRFWGETGKPHRTDTTTLAGKFGLQAESILRPHCNPLSSVGRTRL
jgi:hypothetical protein